MNTTIIFYTANFISETFAEKIRENLLKVSDGLPIISVSQRPIDFGQNICIGEIGRSHLNIYRQALIGAKEAKTKYIALGEDDILYSPDHFKIPPKDGIFLYNAHNWGLYTWDSTPIFSFKDRRNLHSLICERELFIETMEERFLKYPDDSKIRLGLWAEPGKYEKQLKVTERASEKVYSAIPNVVFSHQTALSFLHLGIRKRLGDVRATALEHWGSAEEIAKIYTQ